MRNWLTSSVLFITIGLATLVAPTAEGPAAPSASPGVAVHDAASVVAAHRAESVTSSASSLPSTLVRVGGDVSDTTRTCARSRNGATATVPAACLQWSDGGPVNVVIVAPDPAAALAVASGWSPGQGGWLVAEAHVVGGPARCAPGWVASGRQFEHRLDAVTRRHVKLIAVSCDGIAGGLGVTVADAHTDHWDRNCGGDHAVDWDAARDQLVAALVAGGGHLSWTQARRAGSLYPSGCGPAVRTDGRVAYVTFPLARPTP